MAEYIKRKNVYKMLHSIGGCGAEPESWADGWDKAIDTAIKELEDIPTADVAPVVHAEWKSKYESGEFLDCTNCGYGIYHTQKTPYCSMCGAKMGDIK